VRTDIIRKKDVILDLDVTRERDLVREDVVVADHAVVRDVHAHHKKVARADASSFAFTIRAVKSAILANDIVVADLEITRLAFELHILRLTADHGMFEDAISGPEARVLLNDRVGPDLAIWPNFHVIFDYRCGVNCHFCQNYRNLQDFQDNGVLWILQILFIMRTVVAFLSTGDRAFV
jgi:hypothetical protein